MFLEGKSYYEMRIQSPILNLGFLFSPTGLVHRLDEKSDFLEFFGTKSIEQFILEFKVLTKWAILWLYVYP